MCLPVLNLLNFELPAANKCKYVLTSPRSLKACKRAGVKPTDLLYKSLSDVEYEADSKEEARLLYEAYEAERQRKLAVCRALRNELLLNGYLGSADLSYKAEKLKRFSPKLLRDSREYRLPALKGSYIMKRAETPENMRTSKDRPITPKTSMFLPKVNMSFQDNTEVKTTKNKENEQIINSPSDSGKQEKEALKTSNFENVDDEKITWHLNCQELPREEININEFDLVSNKLHKDCELEKSIDNVNNCRENINNLIRQGNYVSTEDINNNHVRAKTKRPSSVTRKKSKESKKKMKEVDFRKALQHMKIQYSDPNYCTYKYKQVIENSVERDLRELEVQRVQRELEAGMEKWQDRVLLLQWLDMARAREQASRELEIKVERLQQKNRAKNIIHTMNINKVKEAEDMKAEGLRRQVQEKERRIFNLHQEKERIIYESKSRAHSIQELKEQIRSIMTPETFDKKVAKLSMHKKVLDSQMCARFMQRSHIWLG